MRAFVRYLLIVTTQPKTSTGRIAIELVQPLQSSAVWPAKAFDGEVIPFVIQAFKEGHDTLAGELVICDPSGAISREPLRKTGEGLDLWQCLAQLDGVGEHEFHFEVWTDVWKTWITEAKLKLAANVDSELVIETGAVHLQRALAMHPANRIIAAGFKLLSDSKQSPIERFEKLVVGAASAELARLPLKESETHSSTWQIRVERRRSGVGAWYEFFPRSEGAKPQKGGGFSSGSFKTAQARLSEISKMGFDVVYLPPIHPIGTTFRKGKNNSLKAEQGDPGSPWAIGSELGGHTAVHPDLGTLEDFKQFIARADSVGLEVALDIALQCSPDHPWVKEHPNWFSKRIDGTIAYAENPPKKYQDIFPLNFDNDPAGLWNAIWDVFEYWIGVGIRIFRVDNPHTKPLRFWEWLLRKLHDAHPDVVLLAEAFTRPAPMAALARVGFQQSYTYFTWRNTKTELAEYLTELSTESSGYLRPNLFTNTPDILTEYLQFGGVPAFKIRAILAATASPSWGVYSGFELIENIARAGSEENLDNEKYEFRPRDWAKAEKSGASISPLLTRLNEIRSLHPSVLQLRNLKTHWSEDEAILVYSKHLPGRFNQTGLDDSIIVVINLDPHSVRETTIHLDLEAIGLAPDSAFEVSDLISGNTFKWKRDNYVRLDSFSEPAHVLYVNRHPTAIDASETIGRLRKLAVGAGFEKVET